MIKLQKLNSRYFSSRIRHAVRLPPRGTAQAQQLFLTIEVLDEAISQGLQVRFRYLTYGPDKEPRPRTDRRGRPIDYLVNPYQLVAANGRYYLVGNHDRHQDLSYLRVDRITDIQLSDRPRKPLSSLPGYERGLDLPRHTLAHPYMFSGPSALVRFEADATLMDDLIDWFGTDIGVSQLSEQTLEVTVAVNLAAMRIWALQYGRFVRVLSPDSLVEELRQDRRSMAKRYGV